MNNGQQTDIQTLAGQLNCSECNVAKLMKTLSSIGWIHWQPGQGRGHKSELTIVTSFDTALRRKLRVSGCFPGTPSSLALHGARESAGAKCPSDVGTLSITTVSSPFGLIGPPQYSILMRCLICCCTIRPRTDGSDRIWLIIMNSGAISSGSASDRMFTFITGKS